jgi:hypothetical protein
VRGRWLGIVVAGSLVAVSAHAQDAQVLTRPPRILVSGWVGPTSPLRNHVVDSVGRSLERRVPSATMSVVTRIETLLNFEGAHEWPNGLSRADLLASASAWSADFVVDIDIDDDRTGPQLTTLVIERETNAERRLDRIPFDDPAKAVRTLAERIATDSLMTLPRRERCDGVYFEFQVDRQAELKASSRKLPARSPHGEGEVVAQFVVDTSGLVRSATFKSLKATHGAMVREVVDDLPNWRFTPASTRRCGVVSQLVQMAIQR